MYKDTVKEYRLIDSYYSEDAHSFLTLLEHKKTGARVALVENDDENKVFCIGFRTPPKDSTGVAHIVEHTVLCGSDKFPLKDPFVELVKGSLNTFLNAMTYPDKTVYPVASCNLQDFKNLMDVYLDAVFHPNIYKEEKIFRQEGWHYELDTPDSELVINGVVYNEMKGAFSSAEDVLDREILNSLFPDTAYGVESGGDPEVIPTLRYEEYLDFHRRYYHPSNSYIYLYGNMDMEERLRFIDEEYLKDYDRIEVDSFPGFQQPFEQPVYVEKEYPIAETEAEEHNTYLSYNAVCGTSLDLRTILGMKAVEYCLIGSAGAPVRKRLMEEGISVDVSSAVSGDLFQPYLSIVAKNADPKDEKRFVEIIEEEAARAVAEGLEEDALLAYINPADFRYREGDFGSTPKGLVYGLNLYRSWLYDDLRPFDYLELPAAYTEAKKAIGTSFYTDLIRKYILNNPHKSVLKLCPKKGLTGKKDRALADRLAAYKASLTKEEIEKIVRDTRELRIYQETPDIPEMLECLPMLDRSDIKREVRPFINKETGIDGIPAHRQIGFRHYIFCFNIFYEYIFCLYFFHAFCASNILLNASGLHL